MISFTADLAGEAGGTGSKSHTDTQHNPNYTNINNTNKHKELQQLNGIGLVNRVISVLIAI